MRKLFVVLLMIIASILTAKADTHCDSELGPVVREPIGTLR